MGIKHRAYLLLSAESAACHFDFLVFIGLGDLVLGKTQLSYRGLRFNICLRGSMVWGMVPADPQISYEAHLAGAVVGGLLAVYFRNSPPRDFPRSFSYDDIDDDLSEEIARYGPDYWKQNTDDQKGDIKVHYHDTTKDEENLDSKSDSVSDRT